jgi:phage virion morphogenesis protein
MQVGVFKMTGRGRKRRAMKGAGDLLRDIAQNRIGSKRYDPDGRPWRPWSPLYRAPKHGGHTLLNLSGKMAKQIRSTRGTKRIETGTSAIYGNVHQHGHTFTNAFGRGITVRIPARPIFGWGPDEVDGVDSVFQSWLEGAWRQWR